MPRKRADAPDVKTPLVLEGEAKRATMDRIIEEMSEGTTLSDICRQEGMPKRRTVYDWIREDKEFAAAMDVARDFGADAIAEEALRIADTTEEGIELEVSGTGDKQETKEKRGDMLGHRKLRVETRLKLLAKWHPKKYGEKVTQEHTGPGGGAVQFEKITRTIVDPAKPE